MMSSHTRRSPSRDDRLDRVFHALSDRTRRALLERLARRPSKITELAAPFAMSLPAVSRHIRVLEEARLLRRTVNGRVHRCSLRADPLHEADAWIEAYRPFWESALDALARYTEQK